MPQKEFSIRPVYDILLHGSPVGLDTNDAFRASKEVNKHGLFVEHAWELNDIIIAAALLKHASTGFYLHTFVHERTLRRRPYKATWRVDGRQETTSLIPDALLGFRYSDGQKRLRIPVLLEHDRGTEQQQHFRRRIRAYIAFLKEKAQQHYFNASVVTIAFTTFAGIGRLEQMRHWTKQELTGANAAFSEAFVFAHLARPLEPQAVWLEPCWHTAYDQALQPVSLLTN